MTNPGIFRNKNLGNLNLEEIIYLHLSATSPISLKDFDVISSLCKAKEEMLASHQLRDLRTFANVLCAFSILDQIGNTYSDSTVAPGNPNASGVKKALHYFCNIPDNSNEAKHLWSFRNGLMHNASFTNTDTKGQDYMFRYDDTLNRIITLPVRKWNGTAADIAHDTTTYVNRNLLVDATSSVVSKVQDILSTRRNDLGVHLSGTEIIHKYLLWVTP